MESAERRIRDSFAGQDFMTTIGATIVSVASGHVEVRLPVRPGILQQHGFVHAGVVSAIADNAAGYASMSLLDEGTEVLTAEFKINFMAPARGGHLVARARVLRSGRRLTVSACDVFAVSQGREKCVATLLGTIAHRRPTSESRSSTAGDSSTRRVTRMLYKTDGHVLVAIGLLGIAGYEVALRLLHSSRLANDLIHGLWLGACIGLEILGLLVLGRARRRHAP
jgi:uncharacterized protein (TIGR00369 family)